MTPHARHTWLVCSGLLLSALLLSGCASVLRDTRPPVQSYPATAIPAAGFHDGRLRVLTVNIAHGRGDSFHQLLQDTATTLDNLDSIAGQLKAPVQVDAKAIVAAMKADPTFLGSLSTAIAEKVAEHLHRG